jgi:hypothetical protein
MKSLLVAVEEHALLGPVMETAVWASVRQLHRRNPKLSERPVVPRCRCGPWRHVFSHPAVRRDRAQSSQLHFETFMQARGVSRASVSNSGLIG